MPAHVVAGHLAIIVAPLTVVLALVYAARPKARRGMRAPLLLAAALNSGLTMWAAAAGSSLYAKLKALPGSGVQPFTYPHAKAGDMLTVTSLVLAIVVLVVAFRSLAPVRPTTGTGHAVAVGVLTVSALAVAWYVAVTLRLAMLSVWSHHVLLGR